VTVNVVVELLLTQFQIKSVRESKCLLKDTFVTSPLGHY